MRAHDPVARQRAEDVCAVDGERADEWTILARLAVIAAVDEAAVAVAEVCLHRRQHPREAADRHLAVVRIEARRPCKGARLDIVGPDDVQLVAVRPVERTEMDAARKGLEQPRAIWLGAECRALLLCPG